MRREIDGGDGRSRLAVEAADRVDVGHPERISGDRHSLGSGERDLVLATSDQFPRLDGSVRTHVVIDPRPSFAAEGP
ncbi:MAG: hypothetical protein M3125_04090 [Gemmatimonadota bacterium]|nr:hypothetical protein [Gemmatimonadota bacterium]